MIDKNIHILISEGKIRNRIKELALEINKDYNNKKVLIIGILKGCFMFLADLVRELKCELTIDFMIVSSYGDEMVTSGEIRIIKDLQESIYKRHILIVEDIVDTGLTLSHIVDYLKSRKPASIRICTLLDKKEMRIKDVKIDYVGFEIGNEFVIGYGLDYAQRFRELPYIGVLRSKDGI